MHFPKLTLNRTAAEADSKGRTFAAHYVASIEVQQLHPRASNDTVRPALLAYAGTLSAVRAFTANLRNGISASTDHRRFELLRSLGYRYQITSPVPGQSLVLAYLPELFHLQPGVQDHDDLLFVSALPRWWLDRQQQLLAPTLGPQARTYAQAMAFAARLDARTPLPIANDPDFHLGLYKLALLEDWTETGSNPDLFSHDGLDALGLEEPLLCNVPKTDFARFLAEATAKLMTRHRAITPPPVVFQSRQLALSF